MTEVFVDQPRLHWVCLQVKVASSPVKTNEEEEREEEYHHSHTREISLQWGRIRKQALTQKQLQHFRLVFFTVKDIEDCQDSYILSIL